MNLVGAALIQPPAGFCNATTIAVQKDHMRRLPLGYAMPDTTCGYFLRSERPKTPIADSLELTQLLLVLAVLFHEVAVKGHRLGHLRRRGLDHLRLPLLLDQDLGMLRCSTGRIWLAAQVASELAAAVRLQPKPAR